MDDYTQGAHAHCRSYFSQMSGTRIGNKKVFFSCGTASP
jgi:hypothetical protein